MKKFDTEFASMQNRLIEMGDHAQRMIHLICDKIRNRTLDVDADLRQLEAKINTMQTDIDGDAIRLLTVYGPVAADLRRVLACTHTTAQLERAGDQAINVLEALHLMRSDSQAIPMPSEILRMTDLVEEMLQDALDAYFTRDADKAAATRLRDDMVDSLNEQVIKVLLTDEVLRQVLSGATDIGDAVALILISRYLERIADQAVNISKEVIYMVQGDDVRHIRPKHPHDE